MMQSLTQLKAMSEVLVDAVTFWGNSFDYGTFDQNMIAGTEYWVLYLPRWCWKAAWKWAEAKVDKNHSTTKAAMKISMAQIQVTPN